jgi:hypothetical protein
MLEVIIQKFIWNILKIIVQAYVLLRKKVKEALGVTIEKNKNESLL